MSGVYIIGELLRTSASVTDKVPVGKIKPGRLPDDAPMPTLLVQSISDVERSKLKRTGFVRCVERVSVTVRAATYSEQVAIMALLPTACAGKTGTIADALNVTTSNAGKGPDVNGPGNSFERAIDFRVQFDTPA